MGSQRQDENSPTTPTAGEIFADGEAIELLRDSRSSEKLTLGHWREGIVEIKPEIARGDQTYVPLLLDHVTSKALRIPTRVAEAETTRELFTGLRVLLNHHLQQLDACITAMTFTIFASWMAPVLPMAPLLSIFAPSGSPKNLVLQVLGLLCRRPIRVSGLKRVDISGLPMSSLQPTLLLDEPDPGSRMQTLLECSTQRGARIISGRRIAEFYGPKIICSREPWNDVRFEAGALRTALIPVGGQLPSLDQRREEEIAEEFQARFLGYFLRNLRKVKIPSFDVTQFSQPLQELARAFGAAVVDDDELQQGILPLLRVRDEEIRSDRARACDGIVLEAILSFVHQDGWSQMRTNSIAEKVRAIYKGRGSDQQPSAESVGWAIRRLGIPSGRINRAGNGIELNVSTCRLIHKLAWSHGVRAMQGRLLQGCRYCQELEAAITESRAVAGG